MPAIYRLIWGAGSALCAGADLSWMGQGGRGDGAGAPADVAALDALFAALAQAPQVVLIVAQGPCRGGGAGLLAVADIVLAEPAMTLAFPEASLGLVPAIIAPYVVARIGAAAARWLMLSGEVVTAPRAQQLGLVQQLVPADELAQAGRRLLQKLWDQGPHALRETKALLGALPGLDAAAARALAQTTLARVRAGAEAQEGCAAYLAKRAPTWRQRR